MLRHSTLVFLFIFILFGFEGIAGTDIYLDKTRGSPAGDGSYAYPYDNLSAALYRLSIELSITVNNSLTLHIAPGNYDVTGIPSGGDASGGTREVNIQGEGIDATTVVLKNTGGPLLSFSSGTLATFYLTIQHLTLTASQNPIYVQGLKGVLLNDVRVVGSNDSVFISRVDTTHVTDSLFLNNYGPTSTSSNGILTLTMSTSTSSPLVASITNTQFVDNFPSPTKGVIGISQGRTTISGCEITGTSSGLGIAITGSAATNTLDIYDTYIHHNTVQAIIDLISPNLLSACGYTVNVNSGTQIVENMADRGMIELSGCGAVIDSTAYISHNTIEGFLCNNSATITHSSGKNLCNTICPIGEYFDRCYVCAGNSACVGCDNIPFSNSSCSIPVVTPSTDPSNSIAEWPTGLPNPALRPDIHSPYNIKILCNKLAEVDPSGATVQSLNLTALPWFIYTTVKERVSYLRGFVYYGNVDPSPSVRMEQTLYLNSSVTLTNGGVTFTVPRNSLKFAFEIENWQYTSQENHLELELILILSEGQQSEIVTTNVVNGFKITSLSIDTLNTQSVVNLQRFAVIDGTTQAISLNVTSLDASSKNLRFIFPSNFTSCSYDPDFGVLATPQDSSGDSSGGSDTGLIVGLTVGLTVFALLVVVVVILVGIIIFAIIAYRRKHAVQSRIDTLAIAED